jgi:hypothetical protein
MPPVQSFICPHCETPIGRGTLLNFMAVSSAAATGWAVYVMVCPHCQKSLGPYATPSS